MANTVNDDPADMGGYEAVMEWFLASADGNTPAALRRFLLGRGYVIVTNLDPTLTEAQAEAAERGDYV